jgi:hypothetical protein
MYSKKRGRGKNSPGLLGTHLWGPLTDLFSLSLAFPGSQV